MYQFILPFIRQMKAITVDRQQGLAPILLLAAIVGVILFLAATQTAPFKDKFLSSIFPKQFSFAAGPASNPALGQATNLSLTGLDSTIRANWTPSTDTNIAWQIFSVWDGSTLIGTKVLSKTTSVADANGLVSSHQYTIKVQGMDSSGALSNPTQANGITDPQSPMANAAFFDNFNDAPNGDMDPNYYDVRADQNGETDLDDSKMAMVLERHWHTQLIGGVSQSSVVIRPRVPIDFANRTATIEFEVDAQSQRSHGKWWEIQVVKDIPPNGYQMGIQDGGEWGNQVEFAMFGETGNFQSNQTNLARIITNANGNKNIVDGTVPIFTPANVRVPVVLKISQNYAEMFINGQSVVKTTGFNLPFSKGHVLLIEKEYFSHKIDCCDPEHNPVLINELMHWDNIQFDGPAGSYNPVVKTYIQPGCRGRVFTTGNGLLDCPSLGNGNNISLDLQIPEDISKARSARLLFNGNPSGSLTTKLNGTTLSGRINTDGGNGKGHDNVNMIDIANPASILKTGTNTLTFTASNGWDCCYGMAAVQLEVIYNTPRVINNPPYTPVSALSVTNNNFFVQKNASSPTIQTFTTNLYVLDSDKPVNYTVSTPFQGVANLVKVTTPLTGTVTPIPLGGSLVPITFQVDTSKVSGDGQLAVIQATGADHPMAVSIGVYGEADQVTFYSSTPMNFNTFNKAAIPDYHLVTSPVPSPSTLPSQSPAASASIAPSPTPTPTATPIVSTSPSPTPTPSAKPGDVDGNGQIDIFDFNVVLSNFGKTPAQRSEGDLDGNNKVDIFDFNILLTHFGK